MEDGSETSLEAYRRDIVRHFLGDLYADRPTYFLDRPRDSLFKRFRETTDPESIRKLRSILAKHHPVLRKEVVSSVGEKYLKYMMVLRYKGRVIDLVLRAEESLALEEFDVDSLHAELFHGAAEIPKEIMVLIVSFICDDYTYELLCSVGLIDWTWFTLILSTWPRVVLRKRHLFQISELVLRSCSTLVLSDPLEDSDYPYVWVQVGHGVRPLRSIILRGPVGAVIRVFAQMWRGFLGSWRDAVARARESEGEFSRLGRVEELIFDRITMENCQIDYTIRVRKSRYQVMSETLQGIQLSEFAPLLRVVRNPPVVKLLQNLTSMRVLETVVDRDIVNYFAGMMSLPAHGLESLILHDCFHLNPSQETPFKASGALTQLLEHLIQESGPRLLHLAGIRCQPIVDILPRIPFPLDLLCDLRVDSHSLLQKFFASMGDGVSRLESLTIGCQLEVADIGLIDIIQERLTSLKSLTLGFMKDLAFAEKSVGLFWTRPDIDRVVVGWRKVADSRGRCEASLSAGVLSLLIGPRCSRREPLFKALLIRRFGYSLQRIRRVVFGCSMSDQGRLSCFRKPVLGDSWLDQSCRVLLVKSQTMLAMQLVNSDSSSRVFERVESVEGDEFDVVS